MARVLLHCFPTGDEVFRVAAEEALGRIPTDRAEDLEAALHALYPAARVARQHSLAHLGREAVWYVYRDGVPLSRARPEAAS